MGESIPLRSLSSAKANLERLESGSPIFSRALLEYVDRVWTSGEGGKLVINDINGKPHEYKVEQHWKPNHHEREGYGPYTPSISYKSYQALADDTPPWYNGDGNTVDPEAKIDWPPKVPISVASCSFFQGTSSFEEVHAAHQAASLQWLESDACTVLKRKLAAALCDTAPVNRIVCFALGNLQRHNDNASHAQHACIQTLREILPKGDAGEAVPVWVQDPGYTDIDKRILTALDINVVEDPQGFLAITPSTLVMSLSPDIPVRQIVADVQWPAALICDTIHADETDFEKREFIDFGGSKVPVSPYTTDPCSKRVQAMIEGCTSFAFPGSEHFGGTTVYLRRRESQTE
ncbi:uncharacterized protein BDZ99DRAFT_570907 [Mytilinidion resinicola]|uniref:SRR1-like domain-containing protein n=1 Tax=Mytilinidion resinicola TaxID=574789 RepID=A0A6A6YP40_9PEZI|nr:uncharacterized protein BDZ99DRAFT_570907 [Mytilinidion resinicola]KAF2810319.1 hypothetical protein BDZ99DRAFT_570907 [Mytilinidion resinicola]